MKTLSKSILLILILTLISSRQLYGQEWSEKQKEVWKTVETIWDFYAKGDMEGLLGYLDDDFTHWDGSSALPSDKDEARKYADHYLKKLKVLIYDIKPVAIKVHDNVAIVQYYWSNLEEVDGKEKKNSGRYTEIYMKEGEKWILIGEHGNSD